MCICSSSDPARPPVTPQNGEPDYQRAMAEFALWAGSANVTTAALIAQPTLFYPAPFRYSQLDISKTVREGRERVRVSEHERGRE